MISKLNSNLLGSEFLVHYNSIIDFNKKKIVTNFKTIPLLKVTDDNIINVLNLTNSSTTSNYITNGTHLLLKCNLRNVKTIFLSSEIEKNHLPNGLVNLFLMPLPYPKQ